MDGPTLRLRLCYAGRDITGVAYLIIGIERETMRALLLFTYNLNQQACSGSVSEGKA